MESFQQIQQLERGVHRITRYSLPNFAGAQKRLPKAAWVMHLDVDAFYAQVEQNDYNLRGIPVIVGAWESEEGNARGIVATASYEARAFGIETGMTHHEALQRCPFLIALRINYEKYRSISHSIEQCLRELCPEVERYSMDEFYAMVPKTQKTTARDAHHFATHIQKAIRQQFSLSASIGIAKSKSYAKLGSALQKPGGITVLLEQEVIEKKVYPLSLEHICGVGNKRASKLADLGVYSIADAVVRGKQPFQSLFGPHLGQLMWEAVIGSEISPILEQETDPKEYHHLHTLIQPTRSLDVLKAELVRSIFEVCQRLRRREVAARKWEIYLRFHNAKWEGVSIPVTLTEASSCDSTILQACWKRLSPMAIRFRDLHQSFLGVGITALDPHPRSQLLMPLDNSPEPDALYKAMDKCNANAGQTLVNPALLKEASMDRVHFLEI